MYKYVRVRIVSTPIQSNSTTIEIKAFSQCTPNGRIADPPVGTSSLVQQYLHLQQYSTFFVAPFVCAYSQSSRLLYSVSWYEYIFRHDIDLGKVNMLHRGENRTNNNQFRDRSNTHQYYCCNQPLWCVRCPFPWWVVHRRLVRAVDCSLVHW